MDYLYVWRCSNGHEMTISTEGIASRRDVDRMLAHTREKYLRSPKCETCGGHVRELATMPVKPRVSA